MLLETILIVDATMIVGILFVVTFGQAIGLKRERIADWMYAFCLFGILPFTASAILALLEQTEPARWSCIIAFGVFASIITLLSWAMSARDSQIHATS